MRALWSLLRLRTVRGLQYRTAALAGIATQLAWGFLYLFVFSAFRSQNPEGSGLTEAQLSSYVWLMQAFLVLVMLWYRDSELFDLIVSGNLAYEWCRPLDLYGAWFARLTAGRLSAAALRSVPLLMVAALLPAPYGLALPASAVAFPLFVATMLLGLAVTVAISQFVYIGTIATKTPMALLLAVATLGEFCAGLIVPLPFLPPQLQELLAWLPFRLTADLPFRTWSGALTPLQAVEGLGAQLVWLTMLVSGGRLLLAGLKRRLVVQGG